MFNSEGSVIRVSSESPENCIVYDWKSAVKTVMKPPAQYHFKFAPTKRIIVTKIKKNNMLLQEKNKL